MKQIIYHFRISIMLGVLLLAGCNLQLVADSAPQPSTLSSDAVATENNSNDSTSLEPSPEITKPAETYDFTSDLIIKAINPGYTTQNVGELIELQKVADTPSFSLAGYSLRYTNSSGTSTTLLNFSEGTFMVGEFLLLRLARSPGSERADATYMTTLAIGTGKVELLYDDTVVDQVCWGMSQENCSTAFKSASPTTLVRNLVKNEFEHLETYDLHYDSDNPALILPPVTETPGDRGDETSENISPQCRGLEFSEILTYYADSNAEQFIEIYNPTDHAIQLNACTLSYKKKAYTLSGTILPDSYHAYYPAQSETPFSFTKNPNSSNNIELLDADKSVVDVLVYSHGQKKSTAYAKFYDAAGDELWSLTYAPTPGSANQYQEFRSCEAGKVINPATGNCVKVVASSATTECPAGKYRNPLTGRCKNIETESEAKPCKEGYERNPETGRCRKIKTSNNDGADYALVPETYSGKTTFIALGVTILLVSLGAIYIVLQFRHEIARATRKVRQRCHHVRKNLVARGISFHRHKKP